MCETMTTDPPNPVLKPSNSYPQQPCVAVGAIVFNNERVLLVRRGRPPAENLWAIPGGKVRLGETLQQAVEREILEETGLRIRAREPVYTFDHLEQDEDGKILFHYVIVDLLADYIGGEIQAGDDALEASWITSGEIKRLEVSPKTVELLHRQFRFG
jgi:ADP-ribose pyrophosphatase